MNTKRGLSAALLALIMASCGGLAPPGTMPAQAGTPVKSGQWGGQHIAMTVAPSKIDIEFDCGTATIKGTLAADAAGAFTATGAFQPQRPGPATPNPPATRPMRVTGTVKAEDMQVTIVLTDSNEPVGDFSLTLGGDARLVKCR